MLGVCSCQKGNQCNSYRQIRLHPLSFSHCVQGRAITCYWGFPMYSEVLEENNDYNLDLKRLEPLQQWCSFEFFSSLDCLGATVFPSWSLLVISRITHFPQLTWSLKQLRTEVVGRRGQTEVQSSNLMPDRPMSFSLTYLSSSQLRHHSLGKNTQGHHTWPPLCGSPVTSPLWQHLT